MNLGKNPATPHLKALGLVMRWAGLLQAWDRDCTRAPLLPLGAQCSWNDKFFTVYWDVNSDLRITNLEPWLNTGHVSRKKMEESFTSGLELNSMLKTFRSCSLLRKIVAETGREMKREWKKTALHHPDAYLVCNSMPGALTPGCLKGCSNYLMQKTLPLSSASVSESPRCEPENCLGSKSGLCISGRRYGNEGNPGLSTQVTGSRSKSQIPCHCFPRHCWIQLNI